MPKIAGFDSHLSAYDDNLVETRECVRQIDLGLSLKCNKSTFIEFQNNILTKSDLESLNQQIAYIKKLLMDQTGTVEMRVGLYHSKIAEVVGKTINDSLGEKLIKYDGVCRKFSRYFDTEDLNVQLDRKADMTLL